MHPPSEPIASGFLPGFIISSFVALANVFSVSLNGFDSFCVMLFTSRPRAGPTMIGAAQQYGQALALHRRTEPTCDRFTGLPPSLSKSNVCRMRWYAHLTEEDNARDSDCRGVEVSQRSDAIGHPISEETPTTDGL
jgi:hypothetical protein